MATNAPAGPPANAGPPKNLSQRANNLAGQSRQTGAAAAFMSAGAAASKPAANNALNVAKISLPALSIADTRAKLIFNPLMDSLAGLKDESTLKPALQTLKSSLDAYDSATLGAALRQPFGYKISATELAMNQTARNAFVAKLTNKLNTPNSKNAPVSRGAVLVVILKQLVAFINTRKASQKGFKGAMSRVQGNINKNKANKNVRSASINKAIMNLAGALATATAPAVVNAAAAPAGAP
jgi:hypothetical protein